jgi:pleiotropic regulator 1
MSFWDWKTGYRFQSLDTTAQPGSLDAEAGIMTSTFDRSGMRLICGEADKTSKSTAACPPHDSIIAMFIH